MQIIQNQLLKKYANITYAFTNKKSGNLAFHVQDDASAVDENHSNLAKRLSYDKRTLVHMKQIHSDLVHIVEDKDNYFNPPTCDALITNIKNIPLMVMVADCSAIIFYDDIKKVIAVAHAGRAGVFKNIVSNVVRSFVDDFGSNPENLIVSVGASIKKCCYEVGAEIYEEAEQLNLQNSLNKRGAKYHLNISLILKSQLLKSGIKNENIEISQDCTCCKKDEYFSYRAQKVTGRFCGVVYLS